MWNKIVQEQTEADPYKDLKGMLRKGPRGLMRESFNDCVMFHLLTVFPNKAAEQEKYYLSNVLKKPQRIGIRQFVQSIEQLNAYVAQLPCWYYSLSYNPGMTLANVPFSKADLCSPDVSTPVAGPVQPARKEYDSHGHAFSSSFSQGYQACMYP